MRAADLAFESALRRFHAAPLVKLWRVGVATFVSRGLARMRVRPTERVARLFFGGEMTIVLPEITSQQIYTYGFFDENVTWFALKAVREGDVVVDVGAHFGYFALLFSHLVGRTGRVVSFEPTPSTYSILARNAARTTNVAALNLAAGRAPGRCAIADYGLKYSAWNTLASASRMPSVLGDAAQRIQVEVIRLDDWLGREGVRPKVIKIDAENFEAEVIAGLSDTLDGCRPKVIMETGSNAALDAGNALLARGYTPHVADGPGELRHWRGTLDEANVRYKDILFLP